MRLGRTCPDLEAELLFEQDEWQAAFILNQKVPKHPPRLKEVIRLVATTLWLGLWTSLQGSDRRGKFMLYELCVMA
jgi:hypothetical protein